MLLSSCSSPDMISPSVPDSSSNFSLTAVNPSSFMNFACSSARVFMVPNLLTQSSLLRSRNVLYAISLALSSSTATVSKVLSEAAVSSIFLVASSSFDVSAFFTLASSSCASSRILSLARNTSWVLPMNSSDTSSRFPAASVRPPAESASAMQLFRSPLRSSILFARSASISCGSSPLASATDAASETYPARVSTNAAFTSSCTAVFALPVILGATAFFFSFS